MRLTLMLLTVCMLQASATGYSQEITYFGKNVTLEKVFKVIESQTGFVVFYNYSAIKNAGTVTINARKKPLEAFLSECFNNQPLQFAIEGKTILIAAKDKVIPLAAAPNQPVMDFQISGVIKDEHGNALNGATITVKGSNVATTSDASGRFNISVEDDAVLIFSYASYISKEVKVSRTQSVLNVSLMPDLKNVEEVVITAFGIEKQKRAVGYTQQSIDGSSLTQARESNVLNSLKGKFAGVHINPSSGGPSGSSYIAIRGNSSLSQRDQPLFIVDGMPINNDNLGQIRSPFGGRDYGDGVKDINPDDIESVTVLKGPNAAALYGSRGANGVVLITTKKSSKKGLGISFNSNSTFEKISQFPTFQNKWAGGYDDTYEGYWIDSTVVDGRKFAIQPDWIEDQWGGALDGRLAVIQTMPDLGPVPMSAQPEDNLKSFYRTGATYTNTVALSAGRENANMRLSLSNLYNKGIIPNNSLNRQTINLVSGAKITERFSVEAKATFIREENKNRPVIGSDFLNINRNFTRIARHINLDWLKDYKNPDGTMRNWVNNGAIMNPYWVLNETGGDDERNRLIGYISLQYQFTNWLNLRLRTSHDGYTDVRNEFIGKGTLAGYTDGAVKNFQYRVNELNADAILTAGGKLAKNLNGTLLMGSNLYKTTTTITGAEGTNLNYDDLYHISNAQVVTPTQFVGRKEVQSVFFNGELSYNNYLFLNITGRNDWSSALGKPSFYYPSVSISNVITDLLNVRSNVLSYAKLRLSYAQAGNDGAIYQTKTGYSISPIASGFNGQQFAQISQTLTNSKLKNELKTSYEIGADIRLFSNRIGIDFTYYDAATTNQIIPIPISASSGFTTQVINAGNIKNRGIEVFLNAVPVQLKNSFRWSATINFSKNKSKVVALTEGITNLVLLSSAGISIQARPGEAFGNIVGFPYKLSDDGRKVVEDGAYVRGGAREILGNIQPDWLAGVTNTVSFKGFSLSALVDVRKGGNVYSMTKYDQTASGTGKFTENRGNLVADGVVWDDNAGKYVENTATSFAQNYYAYRAWLQVHEDFVVDASYVALRQATLSYDFNSSTLKGTPFKTASISVVGRNLLYLYRDPQFKLMDVSPEAAFAPTAAAQGYEAFTMPATRSIGINLALGF
ncbi:MAG: SusC/RagA family TonB-linked outer membrane protein [Chitinophagaceae bacterium]|nr:SusC/RagA family TonB-linked outer membrane protein [Chitinophagaceae bacterium]